LVVEGARGQDILSAVINLEHVADIVQNSLVEFAVRSSKRGEALSAEELETIAAMQGALHESLHLALAVFLHAESRDAERLVARKAIFREFEAAATSLSVRLLRSAAAASRLTDTGAAERVAQETGLFLRMVRDLRRIHSHLASFAYPALHSPRVPKRMKDGVFTATSVFVKKGRTLSVVRTTITGDGGRIIADVTTSHVPAK
jgi:phosphate:Na+ symporter